MMQVDLIIITGNFKSLAMIPSIPAEYPIWANFTDVFIKVH